MTTQIETALDAFNHAMERGENRRQAITAALTAAAEVEMTDTRDPLEKAVDRTAMRNAVAAERERCAQVAASYGGGGAWGSNIAATIRALKDQP